MKTYIRVFILLSLVFSHTFAGVLYAETTKTIKPEQQKIKLEKKREVVSKEEFKDKKLNKIKKTIKGNKNYKLIVKSKESFRKMKKKYKKIDKNIKVKKIGKNKFKIKIPLNSSYADQFKESVESGNIPKFLGNTEVIQPEVVELMTHEFLSGEENDKLWGINYIGANTFQEELQTKDKIKVGVLDTGIDYTHIDLDDNYNAELSYDFVNEDTNAMDNHGHGTQIAGVIGAEVNGEGIYGVNSNVDLVGLKVLDENGLGTSYDILEAIEYAKENNVKVLNMSFGGVGNPSTSAICEAISEAKAHGIYTVASAGNSDTELTNIIPASCPDAISVGSVNEDNEKADFSNYGDLVDIYAPGVDVYTTTLNNLYTTQNGTSFSAPYVAGILSKELAYNSISSHNEAISNLINNYKLSNNNDFIVPDDTQTGTGETSSGTTNTGSIMIENVDYGNYSYYSGTFLHNSELYGNSLYPNDIDFSSDDLTGVDIYSYDEYKNLKQAKNKTFRTLSTPTNGLVGAWDLNGDANDSSGNGYNGTANNVSWINTPGLNKIAHFNGVNSGINIDDTTMTSGDSSISLWLKTGTFSGYSFLLEKGSHRNISIIWASNGLGKVEVYNGIPTYNKYITFPLEDNKIYHIAYNQIGNLGHIYVNGNLYKTGVMQEGTIFDSKLYIGKHVSGGYKFNGNIGLVKIYNKALTPSEINQLYQEGQEKILGISTGADDNTSTNTIDSTTNYVLSNSTITYDSTDNTCYINESNKNVYKVDTTESKQSKDTNNEGDPVTLSKGEMTYDNTLMSIPGIKIPYTFDISYKNQTYYNGPVGVKWDHNYNMFLQEETNGNVVFYNGKLGVFRFIKNGSNFAYNKGLRATLQNNSGVYSIHYDNGDIQTFNATNNKIEKIEDRYGNDLQFTYTNDLLTKVTDTLGRDIDYTYYTHNRIQDVTDFNGRKVEFSYYDENSSSGSIYDLSTVTINNGNNAVKTIDFTYDTENNLVKLIDSKGQNYVENTYDTDSRVVSQVFGNGTINYSYTGNGNDITKTTVTDKLGYITEYNYDANHNNTSTIYYNEAQTGSVTYSYEYDANGYIVKETRPRGNGYTYSYDTKGNLLEKRFKADASLTDSTDDLVTSYSYNSLNQVLTTTNPNGVVETNTIDSDGNITAKTVSHLKTYTGAIYSTTSNYTYLSNGLVDIALDGEGNKTDFNYGSGQVIEIVKGSGSLAYTGSFSYNDYGNILSSTDGAGNTQTFNLTNFNLVGTGTTAEGIVTSYEYDENNNKIQETKYLTGGVKLHSYFYYDILDNMTGSLVETSSGTTLLTTYKYDENDNLSEKKVGSGAIYKYDYNEFGLIKTETIVLDELNNTKDIVTTYTYDSNNNLITKTDPKGNIITYEYDLYDRLIKETNPEGRYVRYTYNKDGTIATKEAYDSSNNILSKTEYAYDGLGNIVKETSYADAVNSSGAVSKSFVYDKNRKVIKHIDGKGNETTSIYDSLGRLSSTLDALGNKIDYSYDARDLVTSRSVIPNTGTGVVTTNYSYDYDGRRIFETDNLNNTKTYTYNNLNQIISKTDGENNVIDYSYDYIGNILSETSYVSGSTITTSYEYDTRSNLTKVIDGVGNETMYEYDGINRNTKVVYADNSELIYSYDKNSNLTSQTDPNGSITTNTYDSLNRLTGRNIQTGTGVIGVTSEAYIYDDLGRIISGMDDNNHDVDFSYDTLGRLTSETQSGATVSYSYDNNNNLLKITHPDLRETLYTYDNLNRNTTISFSGETLATYSYTGVLNDRISYNNGKTISQSYDALLRLEALDNGVKNYSYTYDSANNIISDSLKNYSYDDIYRLTGVNDTASGTLLERFNYDNAGNRVTDIQNTYSSNSLNQYLSLSGATSTTYTYDANGNITSDGTRNFHYDYKNRLMQVTNSEGTIAEFHYDVLGRRYQKQTADTTSSYIYADKNVLEENKAVATKTFKKTYINGIGLDNLVAYKVEEPNLTFPEQAELEFCELRVIPYETDFNTYSWNTLTSRCNDLSASGSVIVENTYYFHKNHLGSIVGVTDSSGNTVAQYDYNVFGKVSLVSGYDTGNTRLYTGREYDEEIDLYYLRARYYDANLGRFISRDPIGQLDDVNLYAYVGNNSVIFVDLNGLEKQLLRDIENGNSFFVELVARNLNRRGGFVGVHTFIVIHSYNKNGVKSEYTIGGHYNEDTGKLEPRVNDPSDIIKTGFWEPNGFKKSIFLDTPTDLTNGEFVQNIYNEYEVLEKNQKDYKLLSKPFWSNEGGNCNNFSSTVLYNASGKNKNIDKQISEFDPWGNNAGLGEYFK